MRGLTALRTYQLRAWRRIGIDFTEIELPKGLADGSNSDLVREFMRTHRVEVTGQKATAVRL